MDTTDLTSCQPIPEKIIEMRAKSEGREMSQDIYESWPPDNIGVTVAGGKSFNVSNAVIKDLGWKDAKEEGWNLGIFSRISQA